MLQMMQGNAVDDAVDGAGNAVKDATDGVEDAVDDADRWYRRCS